MKKLHLIAAAAALLLSGGVFVKVNNTNNILLEENIEAFSENGGSSGTCGYWTNIGWDVKGCGLSKDIALTAYNYYSSRGFTSYWCCDSCKSTFYCPY